MMVKKRLSKHKTATINEMKTGSTWTTNVEWQITALAVTSGEPSRAQTCVSVLYAKTLAAITTRIRLTMVHICNSHTMLTLTHNRRSIHDDTQMHEFTISGESTVGQLDGITCDFTSNRHARI